jgi:hypothetical protein
MHTHTPSSDAGASYTFSGEDDCQEPFALSRHCFLLECESGPQAIEIAVDRCNRKLWEGRTS